MRISFGSSGATVTPNAAYGLESDEKGGCKCKDGCCCCSKGFKWFVLVMAWLSLVFMSVALALPLTWLIGLPFIAIGLLSFFSLIYWIQACCSNTCAYLKNMKKGTSVLHYMESLFYKPGALKFYAECYHYVITYRRNRRGRTSSSRRKVVTYTETRSFPYQSWRDISGPFNLDTSGVNIENKSLLKLHLTKSVDLASDGTQEDYDYFRDSMVYRLQYVDTCFRLHEFSQIPGFEERTLVQMAEEIPCIANVGCFVLFVLLWLSECYKCCFNNHCSFQEFMVKKLISSCEDLNTNVQSQEYMDLAPKIIMRGQSYNYYDISKFQAAPSSDDTPEDQRQVGPQAPKEEADPDGVENNFQLNGPPVRKNQVAMNMNMQPQEWE